uniref:GTP-binding protein 10 n=1 Tax=Romanomermis culicivorax TaxID=13658 RepID=A0A915KIR2_ROMCU
TSPPKILAIGDPRPQKSHPTPVPDLGDPSQIKGNGGTLYDDLAKIRVRGGRGGDGSSTYGGVGGCGGDVYLKAASNFRFSMTKFLKSNVKKLSFVAQSGRNSSQLNVVGEKGQDLYVKVPMGITIETPDRKKIGDLNKPDEQILVAKGAEGGSAKFNFKGQMAQSQLLCLHLKLIADIGFVSKRGKIDFIESLIEDRAADFAYTMYKKLFASAMTSPKNFNLEFVVSVTTIRPQIGIMAYDDYRRISLADLPGLIEGAHVDEGMGHTFLKHVERTMLLMFVVDVNGFQLSVDDQYRNAYETILLLNRELELYDPALLDKPAILCVNKSDTDVGGYKFKKLMEKLKHREKYSSEILSNFAQPDHFIDFMDIIPICAKDARSALELKLKLRNYLDMIDVMRKEKMQNLHDDEEERSTKDYTRMLSKIYDSTLTFH